MIDRKFGRYVVLALGFLLNILLGGNVSSCLAQAEPVGDESTLRLNQIQVVGTHNSYHLSPPSEVLSVIALRDIASAQALNYSRKPITYQLEKLHVRQLEFDLYADPAGGLFSKPIAFDLQKNGSSIPETDPNANGVLNQPGFKILHSPDFDYRTTTPTLVDALRHVRSFSKRHPDHVPILILMELKHKVVGPSLLQTIHFDHKLLNEVDAEIRSVFRDDEMLTPDQVRGNHATLRDALRDSGWPKLEVCRGKVWFALDNTGIERTLYLSKHPNLQNRVMFVSSPKNHPTAAFLKINDPVRQFAQIVDAVESGLIVRTRADALTREARRNDTLRRTRAFGSGAQYISTDYPEPDPGLSPYCVRLPDHAEFQNNPVSGPK